MRPTVPRRWCKIYCAAMVTRTAFGSRDPPSGPTDREHEIGPGETIMSSSPCRRSLLGPEYRPTSDRSLTAEALFVRSYPILSDFLLRLVEGDVSDTDLCVKKVLKLVLDVRVPIRPLIGLRP
jgi:hypothetical protein